MLSWLPGDSFQVLVGVMKGWGSVFRHQQPPQSTPWGLFSSPHAPYPGGSGAVGGSGAEMRKQGHTDGDVGLGYAGDACEHAQSMGRSKQWVNDFPGVLSCRRARGCGSGKTTDSSVQQAATAGRGGAGARGARAYVTKCPVQTPRSRGLFVRRKSGVSHRTTQNIVNDSFTQDTHERR